MSVGSRRSFLIRSAAKSLSMSAIVAVGLVFFQISSLKAMGGERFSSEVVEHFLDIVVLGEEEGVSDMNVKKLRTPVVVSLTGSWDRRSEMFVSHIARKIKNITNINIEFSDINPTMVFSMDFSLGVSADNNKYYLKSMEPSDAAFKNTMDRVHEEELQDLNCWSSILVKDGEVKSGYIFVRKSFFGKKKKHCISRSFFKIMGFLGVANVSTESLLGAYWKRSEPTELDYRALEVLYSDDVKIGMSREEARRVLRGDLLPYAGAEMRRQSEQGFRFLPDPKD